MKKIRGIKPDPRGNGQWLAIISDPWRGARRKFSFDSQGEAVSKKLDTLAKIKVIQDGHRPVPSNVEDIVLWIVSDGSKGVVQETGNGDRPTTITELIAAYVERQRSRVGVAGDNAISLKHFQSDEYHLRLFREFCNQKKIAKLENAIHPDTLETFKDHAAGHFKSKYSLTLTVKAVKALIMWAWETHRIDNIPRNLKSFRKVTIPDPVARAFTKEQFLTLVNNASPRMKLYLLLAINTGYTQQAIADLEHSMINWDSGIIDRIRSKIEKRAQVPQKSKLWPSTIAALKEFATDPAESDLVILSQTGKPVVWQHLPEGSNSLQVTDSVQRAFHRLRTKCKIDDMSFKHIRKTGADLIKNKYPNAKTKTNAELFDMYLAHKPPKMVLHYDPGDWSELYEATDWLGKFLGLFDGGSFDGSG